MILVLSKFLPPLFFPIGLTLILCLLASWLAFRRGAWAAGLTTLLATALLYAASYSPLSNRLMDGLESRYPATRVNPHAAAIVLLGGAMVPATPPRAYPETNGAGDRLMHAARLWRQGLAPRMVVTGGYIPFLTSSKGSEAELYASALTELFDVPAEAILQVPKSQTTYDDAVMTAQLFREKGMRMEILLVTSAAHMPRAVALFRKQGFLVHPAPTDFYTNSVGEFNVFNLLPSGTALSETYLALNEYVGTFVYGILGRA